MPTRADFVVSLQLLHAWRKRLCPPALIPSLPLMVLSLLLLGITGCGVSSTPPDGSSVPVPPPVSRTVRNGNIFTPMPLPLSANSVGEANDAKAGHRSQKLTNRAGILLKEGTTAAPSPTIDSWFYLVNGTYLSQLNASGGQPVPVPVLTVNGIAPDGAPNPNGGTGVGVASMTSSPGQLWKALSWNNNVILRSVESFRTSMWTGAGGGNFANPLTNFSPPGAPLDLGHNRVTSSLSTNTSQPVSLSWEQTDSPTGDQSAFQQWSYDSNGMLQNVNSELYLWNDNNAGAMEALEALPSVGPDQYNTWFAYPDYFMNGVLAETSCSPAFPPWAPSTTIQTTGTDPETHQPGTVIQTTTTVSNITAEYCLPAAPINQPSTLNGVCIPSDPSTCAGPTTVTACSVGTPTTCTMVTTWSASDANAPAVGSNDQLGEEAAYDYLSSMWGAGGTCGYTKGIRCQYTNVSSNTALSKCMDNTVPYTSNYENTAITTNDWYAVLNQLQQECSDANGVQGLYTQFGTIVNDVFIANSVTVNSLAIDVGLSNTQTVSAVPGALIEGTMYTVLSAAGPVASVMANVMETAYNAVNASNASGTNLNAPIVAEVSAIDQQLATTFNQLLTTSANGETAILQDWGRMSQIGPRTLVRGYNGLAMTPDDIPKIVTAATNGYAATVLSELVPLEYNMCVAVAGDPSNSDFVEWYSTIPYWWSYPTFGSAQPPARTVGYFCEKSNINGSVSQTLYDDLNKYGANSFEFINAINMWDGEYMTTYADNEVVLAVTIYNASPVDLSVQACPGNLNYGQLFAPGYNAVTLNPPIDSGGYGGLQSGCFPFELRPYGYLPIWVGLGTKSVDQGALNMTMEISDQAGLQAGFTIKDDVPNGVCSVQAQPIVVLGNQAGYSFADSGTAAAQQQNCGPAGTWVTIYSTTQTP